MMNKLQAMLWFGMISGRLTKDGHSAEVDSSGRLGLPFPRTWARLVKGPFQGKEVWWLELTQEAPVTHKKVTKALQAKFSEIVDSDYSEWAEEISLVSDELNAAVVRYVVQFHEKMPFDEFIDWVPSIATVTHSIAAELEE